MPQALLLWLLLCCVACFSTSCCAPPVLRPAPTPTQCNSTWLEQQLQQCHSWQQLQYCMH